MTFNLPDRLQKTIEILEAEGRSLLELAEMSGYDPFSFYRYADLAGLNLTNQDLRGLNFEGANLRGSRLEGALYDPGAFNGSKLDNDQLSVVDSYDVYFDDINDPKLDRLYLFVEFRGTSVEEIISAAGYTYKEAAVAAKISQSTLRKARSSQPVAVETARGLRDYVQRLATSEDARLRADWSPIRQPIAKFLVSENDGSFSQMPRANIPAVLALSDELLEARRAIYPLNYSLDRWRDKPTSIATSLGYLRPTLRAERPRRSPSPPQSEGQMVLTFVKREPTE